MYPTRLLLILVAIPAVLSLGLVVDTSWWPALAALDGAIVGLAVLDGLVGLGGRRSFRCTVVQPGTWSHGRTEAVVFTLDLLDRFARRLEVIADLPREFIASEPQRRLTLPGRQRATIEFRVTATRRGIFTLAGLHVAVFSRLGLWRRHLRLGDARVVHVYPNLKQLGDYALMARTNRLSLIGVRSSRRTGGDTEFERLRDYHSDDPVQRIDWKATARRDHLTVRDYQTSQSQGLILLIDAGRMMVSRSGVDGPGGPHGAGGPEADGSTLLDHAIDAALMLAFVALQQGDRVGLIAYADGVKRYVPSRRGAHQLNRLIHALHDVQPTLVESRHEDAFLMLERQERKRSLVVVLTHVLDEVNAGHLQRHCANLVGRHLPIAVLMQDPDLHAPLRTAPADEAAFWHAGAAAQIVTWRQGVIDRLQANGVLALDVRPDQVTAQVVSRYLSVKAKHLL